VDGWVSTDVWLAQDVEVCRHLKWIKCWVCFWRWVVSIWIGALYSSSLVDSWIWGAKFFIKCMERLKTGTCRIAAVHVLTPKYYVHLRCRHTSTFVLFTCNSIPGCKDVKLSGSKNRLPNARVMWWTVFGHSENPASIDIPSQGYNCRIPARRLPLRDTVSSNFLCYHIGQGSVWPTKATHDPNLFGERPPRHGPLISGTYSHSQKNGWNDSVFTIPSSNQWSQKKESSTGMWYLVTKFDCWETIRTHYMKYWVSTK
jgi:hypothetical protein